MECGVSSELDRLMKNRWDGVVVRTGTLECGRELACGSEGRDAVEQLELVQDSWGWGFYCTWGPEGVACEAFELLR